MWLPKKFKHINQLKNITLLHKVLLMFNETTPNKRSTIKTINWTYSFNTVSTKDVQV